MKSSLKLGKWVLDYLLIAGGIALSYFGASTDDESPLPASQLAHGLLSVLVTGLTSFVVARYFRRIILAITASIIITLCLIAVYFLCAVRFSESFRGWDLISLVLLPIVMAGNAAPAVVPSAIGFGRLARRCYDRKLSSSGYRVEPLSAPSLSSGD